MKRILLLFLLTPLLLSAQNKPAKGTTQIFIKNDKTAEENFNYISMYLIDQAIDIKSRDKDIGIVTTEVFKRGKNYPIALTFLCKDSSIRVTGRFKSGMELNWGAVTATDDYEQIVNRGMKGSIYEKAFRAMNNIALLLGNQLTYK